MSAARDRWSFFLQQIEERHRLVSDEAVAGAREALPAAGYDPAPINQVWSAIQSRLVDLEQRIIDTWNEKVEATYEVEGLPHDVAAVDRAHGADLAFRLENAREAVQHRIFADAARVMYGRAVETQRERLCPTCGAPLSVPLTYRAVNLTCEHCRTVATFEPGMMMRHALVFGAHALAWESAQNEWLRMRLAERRVKEARSPAPFELLKDYERAQIAYWQRYIATRATLEPELHDVAHEVRSRMEAWYRYHAEHEEAWRSAGRPRERI